MAIQFKRNSKSDYCGEPNDHWDGHHFRNLSGRGGKNFAQFVRWQLLDKRSPWPKWRVNLHTPLLPQSLQKNQVALTFVNHATMLIQIDGFNILTDPVWPDRVSPFKYVGPKRVRQPGIEFDQLPQIHLVLVSHNHYDHLDLATLKKLSARFKPKFLVPLGDKLGLANEGVENVHEMDWWSVTNLGKLKVHFVPAQHWSGRWHNDRFQSLWGGYVVDFHGLKIYFAGDTGYESHFKEINKRFGAMDLSLLPIGAYEPRWFLKDNHMNPRDALIAHQELQSKKSVAIHFGTFRLTNEGIDHPCEELAVARSELGISENDFIVLPEGKTEILSY